MMIKLTIELPFFLRLENPLDILYEEVCNEPRVKELEGRQVHITFSTNPRIIDNSGMVHQRTTVEIQVETPAPILNDSVNAFAIRDCLKILNRIISSYQAATGEVQNAGYISPLGTSDIQLFADIQVDGKNLRDRWPFHSFSTIPLSTEELQRFDTYVRGATLPLPRLFFANASLLLERGQYSLSVIQAATAVELRLTQYIVDKLRAASFSSKQIKEYKEKTLGAKLGLSPRPLRPEESLETYYSSDSAFPELFARLKDPLNRLRVQVLHHGHLASREEALRVVNTTRDFLKLVR